MKKARHLVVIKRVFCLERQATRIIYRSGINGHKRAEQLYNKEVKLKMNSPTQFTVRGWISGLYDTRTGILRLDLVLNE